MSFHIGFADTALNHETVGTDTQLANQRDARIPGGMATTEQRMTPNTIPALLLDRARSKQSRAFVELWSSSEKDSVFSVSYAELADAMIAAAVWLRDGPSQVRADDYIALLAHNSVAYLALSLGAMSLGAVSVNLNWRQSAEITAQLLAGLQPRLLLASSHFREQASASRSQS